MCYTFLRTTDKLFLHSVSSWERLWLCAIVRGVDWIFFHARVYGVLRNVTVIMWRALFVRGRGRPVYAVCATNRRRRSRESRRGRRYESDENAGKIRIRRGTYFNFAVLCRRTRPRRCFRNFLILFALYAFYPIISTRALYRHGARAGDFENILMGRQKLPDLYRYIYRRAYSVHDII